MFQNNSTTATTAVTTTAKGVAVVKGEHPNSSRNIKNSNMPQLSPPVVDLVSLGHSVEDQCMTFVAAVALSEHKIRGAKKEGRRSYRSKVKRWAY